MDGNNYKSPEVTFKQNDVSGTLEIKCSKCSKINKFSQIESKNLVRGNIK